MSIPTTGTASYELAATLLTESARIATRVVHGGIAMDPLDNCVFGTVVRGIRLTQGAATLIEKRLQGEAFILGRSLFEDSLRMAEIGHEARNKKGLMLEWQLNSLAEMENLHSETRATRLEAKTWRDIPAKLALQRQQFDALAKRDKITRRRFRSDKDAAMLFGRLHDYWTYRWAHEMAHGSDVAHMLYRKVDPRVDGLPQNVYVSTDTADPVMATSCANWCARSLLQSAGGAAVVFGRDPHETDDAFACSNQLEERLHEQAGLGPGSPQPPPPPRN